MSLTCKFISFNGGVEFCFFQPDGVMSSNVFVGFEQYSAIISALQNQGAVANVPPTRPAVKLTEFEEALNNSIPIRGSSHDCEMLVNGAKLMYDYIRQL
jgi:hypothetical protein